MVAFDARKISRPGLSRRATKFATRNAMQVAIPDVIRAVEKLSMAGAGSESDRGPKVYINAGRTGFCQDSTVEIGYVSEYDLADDYYESRRIIQQGPSH